ncbi:MAG TPA: hypothetical protein PKA46_04470 [Ferruginibacter sp.]|nr:hypothetical protein [Ferruginibacter sp.]
MNRVETLIQKLTEQFSNRVPAHQMLLTVQMLQQELAGLQSTEPAGNNYIAVTAPLPVITGPAIEAAKEPQPASNSEEKIIEVLQVDEAELEAELEQIKSNAAVIQQITTNSRPQLLFDLEEEEIPTLPPRPSTGKSAEINDLVTQAAPSLNDLHKVPKKEISDKLKDVPVKDLKKAIGVNDRFLYIKELFRGDEAMYERSIKTINSFTIWPEAEYWIRRELKTKLGWVDAEPIVKQFDQLVRRRFA